MKLLVKTVWVDALRLGGYKQGNGTLKDEKGRYCCLGVLCDIMLQPIEVGVQSYPKNTFHDSIGLNVHQVHDLASLNDEGKSFSEIADYIEETL